MPLVAARARPGGAAHFTYDEFPGWDRATRDQLEALDRLVVEQLEPARVALGLPIQVTSWVRSPSSTPSVHPTGAAIDAVAGNPPNLSDTWRLFVWLAHNAQVGELIYEQPNTGTTGHAHTTLPGYGGHQQILYQRADGRLLELDPFSLAVSGDVDPGRQGDEGSATNPYELPGIDVVVSRYGWVLPWVAVGVAGWLLLEHGRGGRRNA